MAEILPDGTMQGYFNYCPKCKKTIEVNMQGTPRNHKCEVKNLDIPLVTKSVCDCAIPYFPTGNIHFCSKCNNPTVY